MPATPESNLPRFVHARCLPEELVTLSFFFFLVIAIFLLDLSHVHMLCCPPLAPFSCLCPFSGMLVLLIYPLIIHCFSISHPNFSLSLSVSLFFLLKKKEN